MSDYIN